MPQIGNLVTKLSVNSTELERGFQRALGGAQKYADQTAKLLGGVGGGKMLFGSMMGGGALAQMLEGGINKFASMGKEARKVGMEVGKYAGLIRAAGGEGDAMMTGLLRLRRELGQVSTAGIKSADTETAIKFRVLGLDAVAMAAMPLDKALGVVADRMKGLTNDNDKAALATAVFGKQGQQLIPILEQGSEAIKENAARLGEILGIDAMSIASSQQAKKELREAGLIWEGFTNKLVMGLAPAVTLAAKLLTGGTGKGVGAVEMATKGIAALFGGISNMLSGKGGLHDAPRLFMEGGKNVADRVQWAENLKEAETQREAMQDTQKAALHERALKQINKGAPDLLKAGLKNFINPLTGGLNAAGQELQKAIDALQHPLSRGEVIYQAHKSFADQIKYAGMDANEKILQDLKDSGATPKEMALAQKHRGQAEEANLKNRWQELDRKDDVFRFGAEEARARELRKKGVGEIAIEKDAMMTRRDQANAIKQTQENPAWRMAEGMDRLNKMVDQGSLTPEQRAQEMAKNFEGIDAMVNATVGHAGALEEGSQAALSTINAYNRRGDRLDPDATLKAWIIFDKARAAAQEERGKAIEAAIKANRVNIIKMS